MKVRWKKRAAWMLPLMMACAMMAGCGKEDGGEGDDLVSIAVHEESEGRDAADFDVGGPGTEDGAAPGQDAPSEQKAEAGEVPGETGTAQEDEVYVHVCGSVRSPGVYKLKPEARIYEAIEAAGGLSDDASAKSVNQAQKVEDGMRIYVPNMEEAERGIEDIAGTFGEAGQTETARSRVNINSATVEELKTLPGIGDAKARSIVSYRQTNGMFQSIEDLMNVEGIKNGVFEKIKDRITV